MPCALGHCVLSELSRRSASILTLPAGQPGVEVQQAGVQCA
jgi:hypothetical protein